VWDDTAQTQIHLVYHALPEGDPDYPALAALLRLLDDGMSTPLHYRICDQKGLAYHVAAGLEPLHDATLVDIEAACSHAKLQDLVAEVLAILDGFRRELVPADELEKARRRYLGDLEAGFDDIDALGAWFGGTELFYAPLSHAERARRMMRVTAEDVRRVARRVIRPSRLSATAVGALEPAVARRVRRILAGDGDVVNLPAARRRPR
jgi:predicted Zn-dependent peptidase